MSEKQEFGPHYGSELQKLMKDRGIRQTNIAKQLRTTQSSITQIIHRETPSLGSIRKICAVCGVDMVDFIKRVERRGGAEAKIEPASAQQIAELQGQCAALNNLASSLLAKVEAITNPETEAAK